MLSLTEGVKGCIVFPAASQICGLATRVGSTFFWKEGRLAFGSGGGKSTISSFAGKMHPSRCDSR